MRFYQSSGGEHGPPRLLTAALVAVVFAFAASARANSVELGVPNVTPSGSGDFLWTYNVTLTSGNFVSNNSLGDVIALFDIEGYVSGSAAFGNVGLVGGTYSLLGDMDSSVQYSGVPVLAPYPNGVYITGSPNPNLSGTTDLSFADLYFDYSGLPFANPGPAGVLLGTLSYRSAYNTASVDLSFTTDTPNNQTPPGNTSFREVDVARAGGFVIGPTPTASLGGVALFAVLAGLRLRRRDAVQVA